MSPLVEGGCPLFNTSIDANGTYSELQKRVLKLMEYWQQRNYQNFGKRKERVRSEINSEDFATLFIGTLEGGILMSRIFKDNHHFDLMADQLIKLIDGLKK
ncbi:hypothetical protein OAG16_04230 [Saprospiraceae bacterium]|nr:hypothetical protein [Saprospiraceae bacterium]